MTNANRHEVADNEPSSTKKRSNPLHLLSRGGMLVRLGKPDKTGFRDESHKRSTNLEFARFRTRQNEDSKRFPSRSQAKRLQPLALFDTFLRSSSITAASS
ncbi:MAG: hypothetical protein DWI02_01595 [Planctomycetota bacterium]|nr:MAG: hypothetical protein DWI02_01595 [Planctomycetota bacterium]